MDAWPKGDSLIPELSLDAFRALVWHRGSELYRDLPWRRTRDPYAIWVSEVMLQQTQVVRVDGRWQRWLDRFPTVADLAQASQADVLEEWQGMGYNRRALSLRQAAQDIVESGGDFPRDECDLRALPGIGPATAAGIRAFAFDQPGVYLETNVRTVFLHELLPREIGVPDKSLVPLVAAACPSSGGPHSPRSWYYALLDYGAWLKQTVPNPSRRSRSHVRQSRFEGSHRQKRGEVVRMLLSVRERGLSQQDVQDHFDGITEAEAHGLLRELADEGFCTVEGGRWHV